jgi:hypothetical protein
MGDKDITSRVFLHFTDVFHAYGSIVTWKGVGCTPPTYTCHYIGVKPTFKNY